MLIPDETEIEKQWQLERDALAQGATKIRKQEDKALAREYASSLVTSQSFMNTYLPAVCDTIERTVNNRIWNNAGAYYAEIATYLKDIEPLACAGIALKVTFDKVFSLVEDANKLVKIQEAIGKAVEQECQIRYYERVAPGLMNYVVKKYWHSAAGTQQRYKDARIMLERNGYHWTKWGPKTQVRLGNWLLDCILRQEPNLFETVIFRTNRKTNTYLIPTAYFADAKQQLFKELQDHAFLTWPMLIPPNDWTEETAGGYLSNEVMREHDMIRRGSPPIQEETTYRFLNKIQKTAFTLNKFVVDVAKQLERQGRTVGKFIPETDILELPNKPLDIDTNEEAKREYKRRRRDVENHNRVQTQKCVRTRMTMECVRRFEVHDKWFLPWSYDYRGRCYPVAAFLTPQDTDFGKSLLKFYMMSFIDEVAVDWLKFHVATQYGLDKAPIKERISWVENNHTLIEKIATDPIGNLHEWEVADEPWQFLAACEEYYACVISCSRNYTGLPIAVDATCSGLQILAGLARDASTAKLVNVIPSDKPQDAYKVIADASKPNIPECLHDVWDRKCTKRTVMTVPYNAKPFSNRGYIRDALAEKNVEVHNEVLTQVVSAVRQAMDEVVPGPMAVMKWIESTVSELIKAGATELTWTTPSGFTVTQRLMKPTVEEVQLKLLGRVKKVAVAVGDSDEVDLLHHKNATAPNLIHSLDASLLHISALRFDAPLALIHDSVLCRSSDMSILSAIVRETYMHLFAEHDYLNEWAEQVGATTKPPIIGDLEPSSVIESTYFFC
jgi:DNA-directed RNA polymerase